MATRMQQRRGTAAQWTAANPVLAAGEMGFETDTNKFKVGNGSTAWASLTYFVDASVAFDSDEVTNAINNAIADVINLAPETLDTLGELAEAIGNNPSFANTISTDIAAINSSLDSHTNSIAEISNSLTSLNNDFTNSLANHESATVTVHGIANTAALVTTDDSRLNDDRTPIDSSVTTGKIDAEAVTTEKIANSAVTEVKLASGSVTNSKIGTDAVDGTKIADDSISSEHIADESIADAHISNTASIAQSKISNLATDLAAKLDSTTASSTYAPLESPSLTGTPSAPTANAGTDSTQIATTAFVQNAIATVVGAAPAALDTLAEIAAALNEDQSYANTIVAELALKAPLASPTFSGLVTVAANGIAFSDGTQSKEGVPSRTNIVQKTASYTLSSLTERDNLIEVSSASATTITVPTNSAVAYPVGTSIDILQTGAGQVTIAGDSGVTVNGTPGLKLRAQWSSATLFKRATDTWVVMGDLTA